MLNFNSNSLPSVTAREVANEFENHVALLRETSKELAAEIQKIKTSRAEIAEEYKGTAATFIKTTLSELNGEAFDSFAQLAQGVPELTGQGLVYARQKLIGARDTALAAVNDQLTEAVDVDGFKEALNKANAERSAAVDAVAPAKAASDAAQTEQKTWRASQEYSFVKLNADIKSKGAPALTPENLPYYEPTNLFSAIVNHFTRGETYRDVRKVLVAYGNGENGKNVFADMAGYNKKEQDLGDKVAQAADATVKAEESVRSADQRARLFVSRADDIKSDDQILEALQEKATAYLETPEFAKAAAEHYAEDFPTALPLLAAKVITLGKLEDGAGKKMASLLSSIQNATIQQRKAAGYSPSTKINLDLEGLRNENKARREGYSNYTTATRDGWHQTTTYQPSPSVVYVDRSPDFFQIMMMNEILYNNHHHDTVYINNGPVQTVSPYSADLFGVTRDDASRYSLPENAFDALPSESAGTRFDFDTAAPNDFDRQISNAFDSVQQDTPSRYSSREDNSYSGNDNSSSYRQDTPSYGGGGSSRS